MSKRPAIFDEFFDMVICINMDKDTHRWKYMKEQFDEYGIDVLRLQGIPGTEVPSHLHSDAPLVHPLRGPVFGSLLSHANAINTAKIAGARSVLIFEDDVRLLPNFMNRCCNSFLPNVPSDWDMLYLGGKIMLDKAKVNANVFRPSFMYWTISYCVRQEHYDLVLAALGTKNHWADQLISGLHPQLRVYTPATPRLTQHMTKKFASNNKAPKDKKGNRE